MISRIRCCNGCCPPLNVQSATSRTTIEILHIYAARDGVQEQHNCMVSNNNDYIDLQVNYIKQLSVQVGEAERKVRVSLMYAVKARLREICGYWEMGKHVQNDGLGSTVQGIVYAMIDLRMRTTDNRKEGRGMMLRTGRRLGTLSLLRPALARCPTCGGVSQ
jgi:hypothetical protein